MQIAGYHGEFAVVEFFVALSKARWAGAKAAATAASGGPGMTSSRTTRRSDVSRERVMRLALDSRSMIAVIPPPVVTPRSRASAEGPCGGDVEHAVHDENGGSDRFEYPPEVSPR